jgi:hypothetical protein
VSHPAPQVRGTAPAAAERTSLRELALLFLKLGTIAFGGPAAHIAMMEDEVVRRRGWLTRAQFLDYLGATNLIPGPNSTEMAIQIGYGRRRWPGLIVAGVCFILPAALIVTAFAWAYVRFGTVPAAAGMLNGVKPVVIANHQRNSTATAGQATDLMTVPMALRSSGRLGATLTWSPLHGHFISFHETLDWKTPPLAGLPAHRLTLLGREQSVEGSTLAWDRAWRQSMGRRTRVRRGPLEHPLMEAADWSSVARR